MFTQKCKIIYNKAKYKTNKCKSFYIMTKEQQAQQLEKVKNQYGLKIVELADKLGLSRETTTNILRGRNVPKITFTYAFLKAFPEINPRWFFLGEGEMFAPIVNPKTDLDSHLDLAQKRIRHLESEIEQNLPDLAKRLGI